jgi:hypothetical protein
MIYLAIVYFEEILRPLLFVGLTIYVQQFLFVFFRSLGLEQRLQSRSDCDHLKEEVQ